jgi:hypothetical protein
MEPDSNYDPSTETDTSGEEERRIRKIARTIREMDLNGDGKVDGEELDIHKTKLRTQKRIALIALTVLCVLGIYIAMFAPIDRIAQIGSTLDLFFITLGGVIATFMGAEAYITRRN